MSSRFLIPLLCAGAIALACGPRARNDAATRGRNQSLVARVASKAAPALVQQGDTRARRATPASAVSAQLYVHATDARVRLALHVVNNGKKRVELTFPNGQTYDFVILDTLGRELWRWGNGRMFTQALRNTLLGGGEALDLEETYAAKALAPGRYTARATLTSENFPLVEQTDFTVPGTTLASR